MQIPLLKSGGTVTYEVALTGETKSVLT